MKNLDVNLILNKTKGMKFANYDKVNHNGVIPENSLVEDRDIIISKTFFQLKKIEMIILK